MAHFAKWKSVDDLVRIAAAGGGFEIDQGFLTIDNLVRIAAAASTKKGRIVIRLGGFASIDDIVRISAAGQGAVSFADTD